MPNLKRGMQASARRLDSGDYQIVLSGDNTLALQRRLLGLPIGAILIERQLKVLSLPFVVRRETRIV